MTDELDRGPLPLTEEELRRLRQEFAPAGPENYFNRLLATLDQERTLRQAAETERDEWEKTRCEQTYLIDKLDRSLTEETERAEAAERGLVRLNAALAQERQAREQATRWADAWRFAAVLYRGKVTTQREKIEYQRDALQRLEGANVQRKGELRKARAALAACEARLAAFESGTRANQEMNKAQPAPVEGTHAE